MKVSKLIVMGVSYSAFANAELVASQPRLRPCCADHDRQLSRPGHSLRRAASESPDRDEIEAALGGTPAEVPAAYARRSPSHPVATLAADIRAGMRFVDVWSVGAAEVREFRGATCSYDANARWLTQLAAIRGRPVTGYVTRLRHAFALWDHGRGVLRLAGIDAGGPRLPARSVRFRPHARPPGGSCCVLNPAG